MLVFSGEPNTVELKMKLAKKFWINLLDMLAYLCQPFAVVTIN